MSEIELRNVGKNYGQVIVLNDISLEMGDGEFVVLVGPSGCGKSTLLRMIAGLEDITSGQITIGGKVVNNMPAKERDLAMVFQSYALYPHMKVADNMSFALKLAGTSKAEIKKRVDEAAEILGLEKLLDRLPRELSGGQRQRVAMGRAIVRNPRAFLFDEPLSNLDAKLRVKMRGEIKRLHQRLGKTTIYVTHDQTEAMTMADKIVVLNGGKIEQAGAPLELYNNPDNLFVASFIGSPEINLFETTYQGGTEVALRNGARLPLGRELDIPAGTEIVYGVRPQHITLDQTGVPATVTVVEPTGDAQEVLARIGEQDISIVVRDHDLLTQDQQIHLHIDPPRLLLFHKATGLRLR
ncbi:glycerol-3-phosphate ABC transporter ATP-binding protein [Devosia limi DSM 17137]|uniref:Glycerol-3-phosphate ABC transporter ATP-binding protein n=1 Tax=Devosia limi DSM 17137 TaxID=1121477 RepID=A0A0F5LWH7_9HYPH|nr:sn-glycerol-3-phosphate ABC transporter ATP-binding protein UgpC [Devosia limi]KKB86641.1 glycerol-3-phosphate ABC transporter ATP-binding protein [Devosia limi DSM 17137]SHE35731.1 multiple sugar transport system ATP-binding protein [Devosia limi DSM 17137]